MSCAWKEGRLFFSTRACSSTGTCSAECSAEAAARNDEDSKICGDSATDPEKIKSKMSALHVRPENRRAGAAYNHDGYDC